VSDNRRQLISAKLRFEIFERDDFRCVYCGKCAVDGVSLSVSFQIDHVYPVSLGGATTQATTRRAAPIAT
jgi:5-methylcytosine-specific restriction endonuclease McrA